MGNEIGVIRVVVRRCVVMSYGAEATNSESTKKHKRDYSTQKQSKIVSKFANRVRLGAPKPFRNGPHANVVYMDHGLPWAEFIFTYKSTGILF